MLKDWRKMNPEERLEYYEERINNLTPPKSYRDRFLIQVYMQLIADAKTEREEC